jgi:hypothetical protein
MAPNGQVNKPKQELPLAAGRLPAPDRHASRQVSSLWIGSGLGPCIINTEICIICA